MPCALLPLLLPHPPTPNSCHCYDLYSTLLAVNNTVDFSISIGLNTWHFIFTNQPRFWSRMCDLYDLSGVSRLMNGDAEEAVAVIFTDGVDWRWPGVMCQTRRLMNLSLGRLHWTFTKQPALLQHNPHRAGGGEERSIPYDPFPSLPFPLSPLTSSPAWLSLPFKWHIKNQG